MKLGEIVLLACCAVAGIVWVTSPSALPYWHGRAPGSSFLPFWIGAATLATIALLLLSKLRELRRQPPVDAATARSGAPWNTGKAALVMAALLIAVLLLEQIGFVISMLALVIVLVRFVERRSLLDTAVASAATVAVALLFHQGLGVPLPTGPLGF